MSGNSIFLQPAKIVGGTSFHCEEHNPFHYALHKHEYISQMLCIEEGEGIFHINDVAYSVGPGTMLLYHRDVWHDELSTRYPFKMTYVEFADLQIRGFPANYFLDPARPPVLALGHHTVAVKEIMVDCLREFHSRAPEGQLMANHMFNTLLIKLARLFHFNVSAGESRRGSSQSAAALARSYIEKNYNKNITLKTLARISYMNEYHLAHIFKDVVGVSPIQYLIHCRIEVAKRYLATTDLPVKEIAELVGYQSDTSFQNMFKKVTGATPGLYRNEAATVPTGI